MAEQTKHHITESGQHLVHHLKRVAPHNVGEIAGYAPEIAAALCTPSVTPDGRRIDPAGEYAARVYLLKDHPPIGAPGPMLKAGTIVAVTANRAAELVKAGDAEYVTTEHQQRIKAAQVRADREHAEQMAQAMAALIGLGQSAPAGKK